METYYGKITFINGPVIKGTNMENFKMREMVMVGYKKLIGEIISLKGNEATIQVYEETSGLKAGEPIEPTANPLSVMLGPGMIGSIFDGIQRPLEILNERSPGFMEEGVGLVSLDLDKAWNVKMLIKDGEDAYPGKIFGEVAESSLINHRLMIPPGASGRVIYAAPDGEYKLEDVLVKLVDDNGEEIQLKMYHKWPVRSPRPIKYRKNLNTPLITGMRILDMFFPIAKGGAAAIPGSFGTGKTMTQHQLAKYSDADIIVYIGCGERGNEMTEVLEDFPKLVDPKSGKSLMERTILIANTSNMPVAAREASIYTGITIAEYYRDMGYHVAVMADSTSRWAEALREISGRLEEMPAEEGYPAYLPSRLAEFYERAGMAETLNGAKGSVTIIGAVSPAGGDFSEPVTQNTKRYVGAFLGLDRKLAYARHFPAINWLTSYTLYIKQLEDWYKTNVAHDVPEIRADILSLLFQETKLQEIVKLVGEDVLPDDERLVLEIARIVRNGFMQQNAYHKDDSFVPLKKQYSMLKIIYYLYQRSFTAVKKGIPVSRIRNQALFDEIIMMKYNIPNDRLDMFDEIRIKIKDYFDSLEKQYS